MTETTKFSACPRCGGEHEIEMLPLNRVDGGVWGICTKTGQPVIRVGTWMTL